MIWGGNGLKSMPAGSNPELSVIAFRLSLLEVAAFILFLFSDDLNALEHALGLFVAQYLQALIRANTIAQSERAWSAYFNYLVAPATRRKTFQLSASQADLVISGIQKIIQSLDDVEMN